MVQRVVRSPKVLVVLVFGVILGAAWAAGLSANAAGKPSSGVSIQAGPGIDASPNPITSTGTISVLFGGNGGAASVSHSDHDHSGVYLPLTGGTVGGNLDVSGSTHLGGNTSVGGTLNVTAPSILSGGAQVGGSGLNVAGQTNLGSTLVGGTLTVGGNVNVSGAVAVNGNLSFAPGAQILSPRVENAGAPPLNPAAGQLYWDTATQSLQVYDGTQWRALAAGGGAASPILGVVTSPWQRTDTFVGLQDTSTTVAFNLPSPATIVIEFGAELQTDSATAYATFTLYPYVDGVAPQFSSDTAVWAMNSSNNNTYWTQSFSKLILRSLQAGNHTVAIKASISSQQPSTLRSPWLKVTKQ